MITLHVLRLLADNGFGIMALTGNETGHDLLHFEKLPLDKYGVFIMSVGSPLSRGQRTTQAFDLYAMGRNDIEGMKKLEDILTFFADECWPTCILPAVPGYSENTYKNCLIQPISNITNVGQDNTDRVIYSATATVTYRKERQ